jgi:hypothetical protein
MAGFSGKTASFAAAKQTAKGAAASVAKYKSPFSGGNIMPTRETDRLSETDSARDQGAAYVQSSGVEGSPELYVRDKSIGLYLFGAMGTVATTGTTPNYTHTFKPGQNLPYMTFWRNLGGASGIYEKFTDCQVGSLAFSAEAGNPLTATLGVVGITPSFQAVDDNAAVAIDAAPVFNFNNVTATLGGATTHLIRSFELTIENNADRQQTDSVTPYDLTVGQREITLSFDMIFENLDEYRKFHYGGVAGTAISPSIYTTSANFVFSFGTNNSLTFDLPSIAYEEFAPEPDAGGDPIIVSVSAVAQRAVGVTDLVTATLKNQETSY